MCIVICTYHDTCEQFVRLHVVFGLGCLFCVCKVWHFVYVLGVSKGILCSLLLLCFFSQEIDWEECLQDEIIYVNCDAKPQVIY